MNAPAKHGVRFVEESAKCSPAQLVPSRYDLNRVKLTCFALCGAFAALAGVSYVARYKTMQVSVGQGFELEAIAAAVIGGNVLTGGRGSILGTVIGVLFVSMIRNGLVHLLDSSYLHYPVTGVLLIVAVIINRRIGSLTS